MLTARLLSEFRSILGPQGIISDAEELRTYECDGLTNFRVMPQAVLLPTTTAQVQRITAEQLHLDPILMCSANSAGGVMGKMVDAQSIVVATAATNQVGNEGSILRYLVWHSLALASIVGAIVLLYAYVFPGAVPHGLHFIR